MHGININSFIIIITPHPVLILIPITIPILLKPNPKFPTHSSLSLSLCLCLCLCLSLKAKQPTPPLPQRINNQRTQEQSHRDADGDLDHAITDIENDRVEIFRGADRYLFIAKTERKCQHELLLKESRSVPLLSFSKRKKKKKKVLQITYRRAISQEIPDRKENMQGTNPRSSPRE